MNTFPLRHWAKRTPLACLLLPLAGLFAVVAGVRRLLFRLGVLRSVHLPVPVVVVGNIHVGGVGKTPLTLALLLALKQAGRRPAVISRGYGRQGTDVRAVTGSTTAADVGDEPLLLHRRSGCPVWVGADRVAAGQALLAAHPEVDVLLCDDGLQHYRLQRDLEICVLDGLRGWGNGWRLPAGPLREGLSRLQLVDAMVVHGDRARLPGLPASVPCFDMHLKPGPMYRLAAPDQNVDPVALQGRSLLAVAGIGDPERFFATLRQLGLRFEARGFPDHHQYCAADLDTSAEFIVMTEKDAVKCSGLDNGKILVLPVVASVQPDLAAWLLNYSRLEHGRQTA